MRIIKVKTVRGRPIARNADSESNDEKATYDSMLSQIVVSHNCQLAQVQPQLASQYTILG